MTFLTELERLRAAGFPILATAEFISANADAIAEVVTLSNAMVENYKIENNLGGLIYTAGAINYLANALAKLEGK